MKKRGAIYSVVALMPCVAVYLNWYYSKGDPLEEGQQQADGKVLGESVLVDGVAGADPLEQAEQTAGQGSAYFAQARLSRQQARDEAVGILTQTAENEGAAEEARTAASTSNS